MLSVKTNNTWEESEKISPIFVNMSNMNKMDIFSALFAIVLTGIFMTGCEDWDEAIRHEHHKTEITIVSAGHPNVANAIEDPNVQICNLSIYGHSGLSYFWKKNDLSVWGLAYDEIEAYAVAGYDDGTGSFVCRKFDWISSSRLNRDFENINSGYNGWEPEKFYSAKRRCFFIMNKSGSKRTNILVDERH